MNNITEVSCSASCFKWVVQLYVDLIGNYRAMQAASVLNSIHSPTFSTIVKHIEQKWELCLWQEGSRSIHVYISKLPKAHSEATINISILNEKNEKIQSCTIKPKKVQFFHYCPLGCLKVDGEKNYLLANNTVMVLCEIIEPNFNNNLNIKNISLKSKEADGFETLFDDENHSDIVFAVAGKTIRAHKCLLANKSEVFAAMFKYDDTMENKHNTVEITDTSYETFKEMLRFIYAGKVEDLKKVAVDLLPVADKYLLGRLKTICEKSLCQNINIENVIEYVELAETHSANVLKNKAIQFIVSNTDKLMDKPELENFGISHPKIMYSLFRAISIEKDAKKPS